MTCVIRIQICVDKETSFIEFSGKPSQSGAGFQRGTDDEFTLLCSLHTESHLSFVDYCVQNLACSNSADKYRVLLLASFKVEYLLHLKTFGSLLVIF